ncbi:piggyBac transposable element-derived protein 4-like [Bombus flavifrons]|uniref:piggyBac transposable element-derived protein 4-like n=1 Tax=Bombus flavifrons TaxID=103934 RepID=UPI00370382FD
MEISDPDESIIGSRRIIQTAYILSTSSDEYKLFLTDYILEMIVEETNKYAVQCMENSASSSRRHQLAWKPVTKDELNTFIGILLFMGVALLPEIRLTEDRLYKLRNIVDAFVHTFKNTVKPGKNIVIDEIMVPWKGCLSFRQYIPGKRHKYGIKFYKLCLPEVYTHNIHIYVGKNATRIVNTCA